MSIGGHQTTAECRDEWLTPREIITALGPFDLDPCAPVERPWPTAAKHYTAETYGGGLGNPWAGRVWLNPPYGRYTEDWVSKLVRHGDGIALLFARTETGIFWPWVWQHADAAFFFRGRLHFCQRDGSRARGNAGAPSVLVAYGENNVDAIERSGLAGKLVRL